MIIRLRGEIVGQAADFVILEAGGVGYQVCVHERLRGDIRVGSETVLHIHTHWINGEPKLYGFGDRAELEVFELLLTVEGVGTKVALSALEWSDAQGVANAIAQGDVLQLAAGKKVSRRLAERIVLELQRKVEGQAPAAGERTAGSEVEAAKAALVNLGYGDAEAHRAVAGVVRDADGPTDKKSLINRALRALEPGAKR
jgi:Holliday junction DNA helicase RuvA